MCSAVVIFAGRIPQWFAVIHMHAVVNDDPVNLCLYCHAIVPIAVFARIRKCLLICACWALLYMSPLWQHHQVGVTSSCLSLKNGHEPPDISPRVKKKITRTIICWFQYTVPYPCTVELMLIWCIIQHQLSRDVLSGGALGGLMMSCCAFLWSRYMFFCHRCVFGHCLLISPCVWHLLFSDNVEHIAAFGWIDACQLPMLCCCCCCCCLYHSNKAFPSLCELFSSINRCTGLLRLGVRNVLQLNWF